MRIGRLSLVIASAAAAGYAVGVWSAPPARAPSPATAVASIPTSTPDMRPPVRTASLAVAPELPPAGATIAAASAPPDPTATQDPPPSLAAQRSPAPQPTSEPSPVPVGDVVYVARAKAAPLPVAVAGAADGRSSSDRIYSRLHALPKAQAPAGSLNLAARTLASLVAVTVEGNGSVILEYALVGGTWGFGSQDDLRLLMQQIVFTATEEKDVWFVQLRRYGGGPVPVRPAEQWTFALEMSREDLLGWLR